MLAYIIRRLLLMIPTVVGVLLLTFVLFGMVAKDPARIAAGPKATEETLRSIRTKMGLDKPRFFNYAATTQPISENKIHQGEEVVIVRTRTFPEKVSAYFNSQFFDLAFMRFPQSTRYEGSVWSVMAKKVPVSLLIQVPAFLIGLGLQLALALLIAAKRASILDHAVTFLCVCSLAVPSLAAYILLQWAFGAGLKMFPVAGWETGIYAFQYAALPILCSVLLSLGGGIRFFRTVILEEVNLDYVRTARAKGVVPMNVLLTHVLRNVMIPVVTNSVTTLPLLVFGALILERIFQIPGMGGLLVDSIAAQDRTVVMAVTYLTALLYCFALLISDILYTLVDPRVVLR